MMTSEEKYMHRCLQLAEYGKGFVAPNPLVGAIIVENNKIIGEGFHRKYGEAHAEVHAIASVKDERRLRNATLYVNLEPCSHYGKTPPCAELIIRKQIPRVVVGQIDLFPKVSGGGIKMLREAGVEVVCGVLENECKDLNKRFLTYLLKQRPYIILKWAQSSDNFIDRFRQKDDGQHPVRFSNTFTRILNHKMRAEEATIMVGTQTQILDNPQLNVRFWHGENPLNILADSRQTLQSQLHSLYEKGIQSLIVEGGSKLLHSFIEENLWDEAQIEISPVRLEKGVVAPTLKGILQSVQKCENSTLFHYQNSNKP
ncbi:riboflavin biosynthesis protein RibD [Bacteroidia bacterium]|nr:riboflavin biosynthesis protein RibD [Bacteroidia bacterium]